MDYFSKPQPIALPTTVEPSISEKEPLVESEFAAPPNPPHHKKSKFRKALFFVAHLILLSVFFRWISHKIHHHKHPHHHPHSPHDPPHDIFEHHHGGPFDMALFGDHEEELSCLALADWSEPQEDPSRRHHHAPRFISNANFILPVDSDSLLFLAHGKYAFGGIFFSEDDTGSLSPSDIAVDIEAGFWNHKALEQAKVCTLAREKTGDGVGIFTSHRHHRGKRHDEIRFVIKVTFPKLAGGETLTIQDLETRLPLFAHSFQKANIHFNNLDVKTSNLGIFCESLSVDSATMKTRNNIIRGNFTVRDSLELSSSNSPIAVNVTMFNSADEPTRLLVETSNSPLISNITLVSAHADAIGGRFVVDTHTSNSPLDVGIPEAPVDSILHLAARTSNSPAFVHLHPTYEGSFHLRTSIFKPTVDVVQNVDDPAGEGRVRQVSFENVGREIKGSVRWAADDDDGADKEGSVELSTSILGAHLSL